MTDRANSSDLLVEVSQAKALRRRHEALEPCQHQTVDAEAQAPYDHQQEKGQRCHASAKVVGQLLFYAL